MPATSLTSSSKLIGKSQLLIVGHDYRLALYGVSLYCNAYCIWTYYMNGFNLFMKWHFNLNTCVQLTIFSWIWIDVYRAKDFEKVSSQSSVVWKFQCIFINNLAPFCAVGMYVTYLLSGKTASVLHLLSNMQETLILFLDVMFCKYVSTVHSFSRAYSLHWTVSSKYT